MSSRPLFAQQMVTLDASGNGTAILRPSGENWSVSALTVNTSTRTIEASVRVYKNYVGDGYLVDSTISGSSGDTSDTVHQLNDGDSLIVVWSGGDPGANGFAIARGVASDFSDGGFRAVS